MGTEVTHTRRAHDAWAAVHGGMTLGPMGALDGRPWDGADLTCMTSCLLWASEVVGWHGHVNR